MSNPTDLPAYRQYRSCIASWPSAFCLSIGLAIAVVPGSACADAIVRTQAMFATTIAEYFIEEDRVRLELEIGLADLEGFRNLLPDPIYEKLGHPPRPITERLMDFYSRDLAIRVADGEPLIGKILDMGPRPRVLRDEISGDALPVGEDDPEMVVFANIEYPLAELPETITLLGPGVTPVPSIGFVAYDRGIAVNDFRYLTPAQTLILDHEDPWYTQFDTRALRRTYFAPMSGFIYVEPYEVRKEIIVRPKDLQHWIDLGLTGRETIPIDVQPELMRKTAVFLREHQRVVIDGETVEPDLARINFLERSLKTSRVIEPPRELDAYSAILGLIFVYPTDGLPDKVTMDWDLFNDRIQMIPASAVDQAGPLPTYLEPDFHVLEWQNFLKNPVLPTLLDIRRPPSGFERLMAWLKWLILLGGLALTVKTLADARRHRTSYQLVAGTAIAGLVLSAGSFWIGAAASVSDDKAKQVVGALLHNIYRAFDYREEERIYDTLDRSVSGELLELIYLETRKGLELANQGGARAKVKDIELVDISARAGENGTFIADATWNVHGSVGHWGHVHQRSNRYQAELAIAPADGAWKLTGLEILDEQRL